jgi:hypothetical protein
MVKNWKSEGHLYFLYLVFFIRSFIVMFDGIDKALFGSKQLF